MHFTRLTILAIIGVAMAVPTPNGGGKKNDGGDTTTTTCSSSQSTVCCDKSSKGCSVEDSCNNDQMQVCGNTISLPRDLDTSLVRMLKRDGGRNNDDGDTTTTTCSNSQSTMCCDKSGKNCEISDSCSNDVVQMCGNILPSGSGLRLRSSGGGKDNGDGDTTTTTCTNSQSTMCCDNSGKNCEVKDSCTNDATQFCGNTISVPIIKYLNKAKRNDGNGDQTTTTCSNNQSTMCCDKSGKNCEVKDSCSNDAVQICGNSVTVPVTVDAGDVTCMLYGSC